MNLQVKIGCGFAILVVTCLGLTLGTWFGISQLDLREEQRMALLQQERYFYSVVLPGFCGAELTLAQGGNGSTLATLEEVLSNFAKMVEDNGQPLRQAVVAARDGVKEVTVTDSMQAVGRLGELRTELQGAVEQQLLPAIDAGGQSITTLHNWIKWIAIFLSIVGTLVGVAISYFISRMITKPINTTIEKVKQIATGDLTIEVPVLTRDEMGSLAQAMNTMTKGLNEMFGNIQQSSAVLNNAALKLTELSREMMNGSREVSKDTEAASRAADGLSQNMANVAGAMEESTFNVNAVVAAIEEMTATISEISRDSKNASEITESAVVEAQNASKSLEELGSAADEINKVTETITDIADQTNLLALNATIEAARAGEAGKGFAVVANEIKELASQTTFATKEIRDRIDGVQRSSGQVVSVMQSIIDTIGQVNEIVASITHSVSEQATVSGEISGNVHMASSGMNSVNENISESSSLNQTMAEDLSSVRNEIGDLLNQCRQVTEAAAEQKRIAEELKEYSSRFRLK